MDIEELAADAALPDGVEENDVSLSEEPPECESTARREHKRKHCNEATSSCEVRPKCERQEEKQAPPSR